MQGFKFFVILSILFLNIIWIQPSFAEPNYTKNPDYVPLNQTLNLLTAEKIDDQFSPW